MKLLPTLAIAACLSAGSAFAATTPTPTPTATAGATATPAAAPSAVTATAKKEGGHCMKQAQEKKLTGDAEKAFVKECRAASKKTN